MPFQTARGWELCSCHVRHSISCPSLRQEQRIQRDRKRRRVFSTGWQQPGEKTPVTGRTRSVRTAHDGASAASRVVPAHRRKAPRVQRTSDFFAEARGKRPWPRMCPRKRHVSSGGVPCPSQDEAPEGPPQAAPRKRAVEGPRAPTLRGGGARVVGSSAASLLHRRDAGHVGLSSRRGHGLTTRGVRVDRVGVALSPVSPQGRTRASHRRRKPRDGPRRTRLRPVRPLARETSAGGCRRGGAGFRPRVTASAVLPVLGAGTGSSGEASASPLDQVPRRRLRSRRRRARRAERASARWPCSLARGAGIGRCRGRARGSSWLQKSTSGARSRPQGPGSSRLAPCSRGRAQRVKARRKPDRGGESHEHASSETGGGLLVIPRAGAQAPRAIGGGSTRRWKASWHGEGGRL